MKIGIDFDGVITDCGKLKSKTAKDLYGVDIPPEKFKKEIVVNERNLLTYSQYREVQKAVFCTNEMGKFMEPVPGALEGINKLISEGHQLVVITSRTDEGLDVAKKWTEGRGLKLEYIGVGFGKSKAAAASKMDVYVDDDLDKLLDLKNIVPRILLFSWPYNQHESLPPEIERVKNWPHLVETIESI